MNTVISIAPIGVLYYWPIPVTGGLDRYSQNHPFIVMIGTQDWLSPTPERYKNWFQGKSSRLIASLYITGIIQTPIVLRHFEIHCLRPAVSSLGACPTPAP
jgi:hypothetical protein